VRAAKPTKGTTPDSYRDIRICYTAAAFLECISTLASMYDRNVRNRISRYNQPVKVKTLRRLTWGQGNSNWSTKGNVWLS